MALDLIIGYLPVFANGLWTTLWLVSCSLVIGVLMGVPLALAQALNLRVLGALAFAFSYAFRGTPLLVQLYLIYYGLAQFDAVRNSPFWLLLRNAEICALIAFSLNSAAYGAEILRGAIVNIPDGLMEAAQSMGLTRAQSLRLVILPLAFRRSIPAYSNEVIFMIHASVIASTISVVDILGAGRQLNSTYYLVYEGLLVAAVMYMTIVFLVSAVFRRLEARFLAYLAMPDGQKTGAPA
jgi:arginine/ornithine transport system permease protein